MTFKTLQSFLSFNQLITFTWIHYSSIYRWEYNVSFFFRYCDTKKLKVGKLNTKQWILLRYLNLIYMDNYLKKTVSTNLKYILISINTNLSRLRFVQIFFYFTFRLKIFKIVKDITNKSKPLVPFKGFINQSLII